MKSKEEIDELYHKCWDNFSSKYDDNLHYYSFIEGYTQCQEDSKDKKYTLRDIEKAFLEGCASERKFSRRIDDLDKYINSLNKQD